MPASIRPDFLPSDGDGPAVLALHCSAGSPSQWRPYAGLRHPGVRLLAPALLGYDPPGSWSRLATLTLDDEALRLAPLLAQQRHGVHLVGHSYGGAVALQAALRWPGRVLSVTVYEPVRFALLRGVDAAAWGEVCDLAQAVTDLASAGWNDAAAEWFVDYWSGEGAWEALSERHRAYVAAAMPKVAAEFGAALDDPVPASAWRDLRVPLRLVSGGRSPRPARRVVEILAAASPRASNVVLPGLGHMGPIDDPVRVASAFAWDRDVEPLPAAA